MARASARTLRGAAFLLVLASSNAFAQVIPPGHEAEFRDLLDAPLGWEVTSIRIEARRVSYELQRDGREATLHLLPPERPPPSFDVDIEASDEDTAALLAHVRATLAESDFDPWVDARESPRVESREESRETPRRALYGALAALLAFVWLGLAFRKRSLPYVAAALGTLLVVAWAWAADDAFITYRYLDQAAHGHGLVFNQGERVQGFTHPLWMLLLLGPSMLVPPFDASMLAGIVCTTLLFAAILRARRPLGWTELETTVVMLVLLGAETFVAFQTSGLESSLGHLLLLLLLVAALEGRPRALAMLAALLVLTRLDYVLLALPLVAGAMRDLGGVAASWRRERIGIGVGLVLVVGWLAFAALYYGYPLPNTFYAKTGEGWPVGRGLRYLGDFAMHEPSSAAVLLFGLFFLCRGDQPVLRRIGFGALLHLAYVVSVGGDYMRGRFLSAALLVAALGAPALLRRLGASNLRGMALVALASTLSFVFTSRAHLGEVVNERAYHPESQLLHIGDGHVVPHRLPVELEETTLGGRVMAHAFTDDPRLVWLDAHGLVDPFVARCPALPDARAGHVDRRIPRAYFEARRDARLVDDGEARLRRADPTLSSALDPLPAAWPTPELEQRFEELRLLATGDLWDPARLRLIPKYTFSTQRVEVPDDAETYDPP